MIRREVGEYLLGGNNHWKAVIVIAETGERYVPLKIVIENLTDPSQPPSFLPEDLIRIAEWAKR